jgi:hypothetical protein
MNSYSRIEEYTFGNITIDGEKYTSDVIIFPRRITDWWREKGHFLQPQDITEIMAAQPDVIIVGTGYHGRMSVSDEVKDLCLQRNIKLYIKSTGEAVKLYNKISKQEEKTIVAGLHLTC